METECCLQIVESLETIYGPEIHANIHDLGFVYTVDIDEKNIVSIIMIPTRPGCPVANFVVLDVQDAVGAIDWVKGPEIDLVWEPPWNQNFMSEAAQLELGIL